MRTARVLAVVAALAASLAVAAPVRAASPSSSENAGAFIVQLRDGVDARATAAEYRRRDAVDVSFVYQHVFDGFAGTFSNGALGRLQQDRRVARIERDGVARASAVTSWGLDRIDQRALALDGRFDPNGTGGGVHAYVIDTGIDSAHGEFAGSLGSGTDTVGDGRNGEDCNGHGTHVAGTIGGDTFGVAPDVTLHAVRVLDCNGSGSWSGVAAGIDWAYADIVRGGTSPAFPAVANMSLGGGASSLVDTATARLAQVATVAVAAGNSNANACNYSPARVPAAVTVGATTQSDARASYSNWGTCLDLFAPGSSITSAWIGAADAENTISGTSMASPHVAGVAATLASGRAPAQVVDLLTGAAYSTANVLPAGLGTGSPNRLLFNGSSAGHPPTVSVTGSCSGSTCTLTATGRDPDGTAVDISWTNATGGSESDSFGKAVKSATTAAVAGKVITATATSGGESASDEVTISCSRRGSKSTCKVS